MPLCCRCNGSGRCINCYCAKSGKLCVDCLPSRRGGCQNLSPTPTSHGLASSDPIVDVVTNTVPQESLQENLDSVLTPRQSLQNEPLCSDLTEKSVIVPSLLPYRQSCEPCFAWGNCEGAMFQGAIVDIYKIVVHWRRNIFRAPSGKAGKLVVRELTLLFQAYAEASTLESVAITAAMVLPSLILQKPHPSSSKAKEHIECIERRLKLWKEGNIKELVKEGQTIQQHLKNITPKEIRRKSGKILLGKLELHFV